MPDTSFPPKNTVPSRSPWLIVALVVLALIVLLLFVRNDQTSSPNETGVPTNNTNTSNNGGAPSPTGAPTPGDEPASTVPGTSTVPFSTSTFSLVTVFHDPSSSLSYSVPQMFGPENYTVIKTDEARSSSADLLYKLTIHRDGDENIPACDAIVSVYKKDSDAQSRDVISTTDNYRLEGNDDCGGFFYQPSSMPSIKINM